MGHMAVVVSLVLRWCVYPLLVLISGTSFSLSYCVLRICYLMFTTASQSLVKFHDLWLAKDNRLLNPKSSYERILMAPTCRLINLLPYKLSINIIPIHLSFSSTSFSSLLSSSLNLAH